MRAIDKLVLPPEDVIAAAEMLLKRNFPGIKLQYESDAKAYVEKVKFFVEAQDFLQQCKEAGHPPDAGVGTPASRRDFANKVKTEGEFSRLWEVVIAQTQKCKVKNLIGKKTVGALLAVARASRRPEIGDYNNRKILVTTLGHVRDLVTQIEKRLPTINQDYLGMLCDEMNLLFTSPWAVYQRLYNAMTWKMEEDPVLCHTISKSVLAALLALVPCIYAAFERNLHFQELRKNHGEPDLKVFADYGAGAMLVLANMQNNSRDREVSLLRFFNTWSTLWPLMDQFEGAKDYLMHVSTSNCNTAQLKHSSLLTTMTGLIQADLENMFPDV